MKEHVEEFKAEARGGRSAGKEDGDAVVRAKIAGMPAADREMGERLHAIIMASAPELDDGTMWPTAFAITRLTAADEARIGALVKKAAG